MDTLILGENRLWKQNTRMGASNNRNFVQMPISALRSIITYKAALAGIRVVCREESYTSKASFLDDDYIPTYGVDDKNAVFSGLRIKRGLYRTSSGLVVNADINGAANILRKADPYAWENRACLSIFSAYHFLTSPEVYGFHELNPPSIPVERIKAA